MTLLQLNKINVFYGDVQVLRDVSIDVHEGEIVSIIGANGAGKSTTLNTISGLLQAATGEITFLDQRIDLLELHEIARLGVIQIPEGRRLFPHMTVLENLEMGSYAPEARALKEKSLENVHRIFPVLKERSNQLARTLSGGEQQMLAVGRGLMAKPKLLMLDEPSLGLAPILAREIFEALREINSMGTTVLLVEQDVQISLSMSERGYVLENGQIVMNGPGGELLRDPHVKEAYLGV